MDAVDAVAAMLDPASSPGGLTNEARLAKWRVAAKKAQATGKMANTLAKALARRFSYRWQFMDFLGPSGRESAGVVDIVAIRKCGKQPTIAGLKKLDLFDIQLIQVKGGGAPMPRRDEIVRLRLVQEHYRADGVVLFQWVRGERARFSRLDAQDRWVQSTADQLFGLKS